MKKLMSIAFAAALAFGSVCIPVNAQETTVVNTVEKNPSDWIDGSFTSLQDGSIPYYPGEDAFIALSQTAYGLSEEQLQKSEEKFIPFTQKRIENPRAAANDVEKMIMLVEAYGYDASAYEMNGKIVNLYDMLSEFDYTYTNDYVFALEALHSGNHTPEKGSKLDKDELIKNLITLRNPKDHAWNYNGDYSGSWGSSDTDTTAMVLTALAPYYNLPESETGISVETRAAVTQAVDEGFVYLRNYQDTTGAMKSVWSSGNSNTTAMMIVTMAAYGKDMNTEFVVNGNTLMDGLMSFALDNKKGFGGTDNSSINGYGTEQAVRALVAYKNAKAGTPYYLYQAGAVLNENRFQTPLVDETIEVKGNDVLVQPEVIKQITDILQREDSKQAVIQMEDVDVTKKLVLPETIFEAAKETKKPLTVALKDVKGVTYTWKFKNVTSTESVNLQLEIKEAKQTSLINVSKDALVLDFAHKGKLPGETIVFMYVGNKFQDGEVLRVAYYDEEQHLLKDAKEYTVTQGYLTMDLPHCSMYIVEKVKAQDNAQQAPEMDTPKTEPVIKDTSSAHDMSIFTLALLAGAGLVLVRKKA